MQLGRQVATPERRASGMVHARDGDHVGSDLVDDKVHPIDVAKDRRRKERSPYLRVLPKQVEGSEETIDVVINLCAPEVLERVGDNALYVGLCFIEEFNSQRRTLRAQPR